MSDWHVPEPALRAWVEGTTTMAMSASVEQHLMSCPQCRAAVAVQQPGPVLAPELDDTWMAIREQIEPQQLNPVGRALRRLGIKETDAILLSTSPALTGAWLTAIALVGLFSISAALWTPTRALSLLILAAPLLPMAGVAAAYGAETDPTHEITLSAPYSKIRLLLMRTGLVVATCVPLTIAAAVPIEGPWWLSVVWLLPALAFVLTTLAAATYMPPTYAATGIAAVWLAVSLPALVRREPSALYDTTALVTYTVIALVAGLVFTTRLKHLATDWRIG